MSIIQKALATNHTPTIIVRLTVGFIFISEGIQKFIFPDTLGVGRFTTIGFGNPEFWASFTACFEIICGLLLLMGLLTRFATIPLLIIMATAFITTKWTILMHKGFFPFAHEYRTDFAMTMLLIYLLIQGGGRKSMDEKLYGEAKK